MLLTIKYNNCWFPVVVSSLSPTVVVPVAASSVASTAYTSPTPRHLRIAERRINIPQDLGSVTAPAKDKHETQHLIIDSQ